MMTLQYCNKGSSFNNHAVAYGIVQVCPSLCECLTLPIQGCILFVTVASAIHGGQTVAFYRMRTNFWQNILTDVTF